MIRKIKVFNTEVAIADLRSIKIKEGQILRALNWMEEAEGLTKEEMKRIGLLTRDEWMIEVEIEFASFESN